MALIKLKRGPSSNITSLNLEAGEPAYTTDTGKLYIGNSEGGKTLINPDGGSATTAEKLTTARNISASGDATAPAVPFDGTQNVDLVLSLKNSGVTAGAYTKVTVDTKGRVTAGASLVAGDIPALTLAKITDAGTAASKNTGTASGNVPVLGADGKLDAGLIPASAITDTFVVATEAAMLALSAAGVGDVAVRTDLSKSFILKATPASASANWQELLTPTSPVQSVNGMTGAVMVTTITGNAGTATKLATPRKINNVSFDGSADITVADDTKELKIAGGAADTYWNGLKAFVSFAASVLSTVLTGLSAATSTVVSATDTVLVAIGKLQAQVTLRAPLASPALTGTPTAPTAAASVSSTQIATTAYVKSQGYLSDSSVIDGGTF